MNRAARRNMAKKGVVEQVVGTAISDTQRKIRMDAVNDFSTMVFMVLHDKYGFGEKRIKQFYHELAKLGDCMKDGLANMQDMRKTLLDECGIKIDGRCGE